MLYGHSRQTGKPPNVMLMVTVISQYVEMRIHSSNLLKELKIMAVLET